MRGHHDPYRCMLCGIETKTHDEMMQHFKIEHYEHWKHMQLEELSE